MKIVAYHAIVPAEMAGFSALWRLHIGMLPFILPKRQETQSAAVRRDDKVYFASLAVSRSKSRNRCGIATARSCRQESPVGI
jgi:hypothetical protein